MATLVEKGLKFEVEPVDLRKGEHKVRSIVVMTQTHSVLIFRIGSEISGGDATVRCYSCPHR